MLLFLWYQKIEISQWYNNWNKSLISSEKMPVKIIYTTELHEYEIKC